MITVSTLKASPRNYHHGDLRTALLQEGLRLVEESGAEALSLREVARAAGVSATAVYRHFPDKRALMTALANEGVTRLAAAQKVAADQAPDLRSAFLATGRTYVEFALANPALFRLTFTYPEVDAPDPAKDTASFLLYGHALEMAGGNKVAAQGLAMHAWSLVHGLSMLMLDGRIPADLSLIDGILTSDSMPASNC